MGDLQEQMRRRCYAAEWRKRGALQETVEWQNCLLRPTDTHSVPKAILPTRLRPARGQNRTTVALHAAQVRRSCPPLRARIGKGSAAGPRANHEGVVVELRDLPPQIFVAAESLDRIQHLFEEIGRAHV